MRAKALFKIFVYLRERTFFDPRYVRSAYSELCGDLALRYRSASAESVPHRYYLLFASVELGAYEFHRAVGLYFGVDIVGYRILDPYYIYICKRISVAVCVNRFVYGYLVRFSSANGNT